VKVSPLSTPEVLAYVKVGLAAPYALDTLLTVSVTAAAA